MIHNQFEACGTLWKISIDANDVPDSLFSLLQNETRNFESVFSRFIPGSEVNLFREAKPGVYEVSKQLATILEAAVKLQALTEGGFDASIASLFEKLGYDNQYRLKDAPESINWKAPHWSIEGTKVTTDGPIVFDVGGIGKGYWIDILSQTLKNAGFPYHLVDGGGDMMATRKASGEGWSVALEWPGKSDTALGKVVLLDQGLAVSDVFRRSWKNWNHLIHAKTLKPVSKLKGCIALAPSAFLADQLTSALAFLPENRFAFACEQLQGEYLVMHQDDMVSHSLGWQGELFV